jgi:hypothetical protein
MAAGCDRRPPRSRRRAPLVPFLVHPPWPLGLFSSPFALPRAQQPRWRRRQQHPPRANPSTERLRGDGGCGLRGSGKYIAPDYLVVRSTVHSIANLCAPRHSAVGGFESERCFAFIRGCRGRCRPRRCRSWWGGTRRCRSSLNSTRPGAGPVFRWRRTSRWWGTLPASFPSFGSVCCSVTVVILANTMPVCEVATNETMV